MGNSNQDGLEWKTQTKMAQTIPPVTVNYIFIFLDLKGKGRFPETPGDSEDNLFIIQLTLCLVDAEKISMHTKYKYQFVTLHKRKLAEAKK